MHVADTGRLGDCRSEQCRIHPAKFEADNRLAGKFAAEGQRANYFRDLKILKHLTISVFCSKVHSDTSALLPRVR
jgi:hypothetical protein